MSEVARRLAFVLPVLAAALVSFACQAAAPAAPAPTGTVAPPMSDAPPAAPTPGAAAVPLPTLAPPTTPPGVVASPPAAAPGPAPTAAPPPTPVVASPAAPPPRVTPTVESPSLPPAPSAPDIASTWHTGEPSCPVFAPSDPWNTDISAYPVHPRSAEWVASVGLDTRLHPDVGTVWQGAPIGIPYVVVTGDVGPRPVTFDYAAESDPGPYPIPSDVPIEAGADAHVLVVDDRDCLLYELFAAESTDGGATWHAGSGAVFDLRRGTRRPAGWTSADAAGLPIFPGLIRYGEVVEEGKIDHVLRFTARRTQRAYLPPATHWASSITDAGVPPMGARFRMRADYDCSGYSAEVQVICTALKRYGMMLADNGSDWYLSGAPDPRWNDEALGDLKRVPGSAFEVVDTGAQLHSPFGP